MCHFLGAREKQSWPSKLSFVDLGRASLKKDNRRKEPTVGVHRVW